MSDKLSLYQQFRKKAWDSFIPLNATIELSVRCNFKCLHCYNFDRQIEPDPKLFENELSLSEIKHSILKLKELGCINMTFTGGESLLHPHIDELIKFSSEHGFLVRIKTNGFVINKNRAKELKELGVSFADVSIYGLDDETYKIFSKINHASEKVYDSLKFLTGAGIETSGNIVIHKYNYKDLVKMRERVEAMGARAAHSDEITDRYTDENNSKSVELDDSDYEYIFNSELKDYFMVYNDEFAPQCACARTNIGITAKGDVYPCIGAPIKAGSLREDDLINIWKNSSVFKMIRGLKEDDFKECSSCEVKLNCQRSSGAIYANTKNYTGCDKSTLRLSKLRSKYS